MKKLFFIKQLLRPICFIFLFSFLTFTASSQTGLWTWVKGDFTAAGDGSSNHYGVYVQKAQLMLRINQGQDRQVFRGQTPVVICGYLVVMVML